MFKIITSEYIRVMDLNIGDILKIDEKYYDVTEITRNHSHTNVILNITTQTLDLKNSDYIEIYKYGF
jgi:hypothetical protein